MSLLLLALIIPAVLILGILLVALRQMRLRAEREALRARYAAHIPTWSEHYRNHLTRQMDKRIGKRQKPRR